MEISNRQILQSMLERRTEEILDNIDKLIAPFFCNSPAMGKIALTFVDAKKREYIPQIQDYIDLLVETACLNPDVSLTDSIFNAENILNDFLAGIIESKLQLPKGIINVSLSTLFEGEKLVKL